MQSTDQAMYRVTVAYLYSERQTVSYIVTAADHRAAEHMAVDEWETTADARDGAELIGVQSDYLYSVAA